MKRILFVDDEEAVLDGLRNVLRSERSRWEMEFANSGREALKLLASSPFNVAIVDMRMPEMNGQELLERIRREYPDVIRIVLSGYADLHLVVTVSGIAHQYLAKPCDADTLKTIIGRACSLQEVLVSDSVRKAIGALGPLPTTPSIYSAINQELNNPNMSVKRVARIVERDVGFAARVLKFVNSAYFGFAGRIANIEHAVVCIGATALRDLALSTEVFSKFGAPVKNEDLEFLETHALLTGRIAKKLVPDPHRGETAFAAGLLHDVGKLILLARLPKVFAHVISEAKTQQKPLIEVEKAAIGANHAEIGAYLLALWGLPAPILGAVAEHHQPRTRDGSIDIPEAVRVANLLALEIQVKSANEPPLYEDAPIDLEETETDRLVEWRKMAAAEAKCLTS